MIRGGEASRGAEPAPGDDLAVDDQGDLLGPAEVEMVGDGCFEPGPGVARLAEHGGVGDLQLLDGKTPLEPGPAVDGEEGVGQDR